MTNSQIVKQVMELLNTLQQRMKGSPVETFTFIAVVTPDGPHNDDDFISLGAGSPESQMLSIMLAMASDPQAALTFSSAIENYYKHKKSPDQLTLATAKKAQE